MPRAASTVGVGRRVTPTLPAGRLYRPFSTLLLQRYYDTLTVTLFRPAHSYGYSAPRIFEEKRDCSQSNLGLNDRLPRIETELMKWTLWFVVSASWESKFTPALISGFCCTKRLRVFLLPLDGMLVHRRVTLSIKFVSTHLYTWVERGTVRVVLPKNTTLSPVRARTRTALSGDERTNHEATICFLRYQIVKLSAFARWRIA